MTDIKKFLMIGGGLGFIYGGALLLAMDAFTTASFILYGNRWTIPLMTAITITMITAIGGPIVVLVAPAIQDKILEEYSPEDDEE
jgi:hypothetical protein